jgi:hypothetical protein
LKTFPTWEPQRSQTEVAKFHGLPEYAFSFAIRREMDCLASAQWRQKGEDNLHSFSMYRIKLENPNAFNHQKLNAKTSSTVKATSDALPDMGTTAVTDRSC